MIKRSFFFIALTLSFPVLLSAQIVHKALFLGNSYTYVNDLPGIVASLADAGGDSLIHDNNTPGGHTLEGHASNPTSLQKIASNNWDFVILQDQSQRPSFPPAQVAQICYPYADSLNRAIKANDHCTETLFYMTWGRKNGDAMNCAIWPPVCTYSGMQDRLRSSYMQMAIDNDATVSPAGVAWWESILRNPGLDLFSADESHPAYTGSYLTACVFYSVMYRKSPVGLNFYGSLDSATATFLQDVAADVVFDSLDQWRVGHADLFADFGYSISNGNVQFSDSSTNATAWSWDFGDGGTDSVANPSHVYGASGQYVVTLIADNGCMQDTLMDTLDIVIVGLAEEREEKLVVSPNPSDGLVRVEMGFAVAGGVKWQLMDVQGRVVWQKDEWLAARGLDRDFDFRGVPRGTYVLQVRGVGFVRGVKLVLR